MIGTVEFYALPGALSTSEYPIMTEGQDISSHLVHSIPNCKFTKDLLQAFGPVEVFEGYDGCNMVRLNGEFYWIASVSTRTLKQKETVMFGLVYAAPTSKLRLGQNLTGVFAKTPTRTKGYLSMSIANDAMESSRHVNLPNLGTYKRTSTSTEEVKLLWCEITTSGYRDNHSKVRRIGFFVGFDPVKMVPWDDVVMAQASASGGYPSMKTVIDNPEDLLEGAQADEIIQISISERCPYRYTIRQEAFQDYMINTVRLDDASVYNPSTGIVYRRYVEGLTGALLSDRYWPTRLADPQTVSMTLTDMERALGSLRLVNESGSTVATIPTQYGSSIELSVLEYSDYSGMYTDISYEGRVLATLNSGKLPWVGDAWKQYQARQMEMDRAMMSMANEQARADLELSLRQSELNQVMTQINSLSSLNLFSPGSFIGAGLGILEADWKGSEERRAMTARTQMETYANEMKQMLTEKQMKSEPGTAYSMGYGVIYCYNTVKHPAKLNLEMPANVTQQYFNDWTAEFGWPAEGKQTIELSAGFVQGQLIADGSLVGYKFDELQKALKNGIKMKVIN